MKKILCPTDFSDAAHDAIAYAAKLARDTNSDLSLLHVQSVFDLTPTAVVGGSLLTTDRVAERLDAQCREVTKTFRVSCYAEIESGTRKLSSVIKDKAKGCDLVVMGSDGPNDLYQFFSGSNTYNTIVKSKIPVLLVPLGYVYSKIKTMVYAFDYLHERSLPLDRLLSFLNALKCELTVLQVIEEAQSKKAEKDLAELQFIIAAFNRDDIKFRYDTIRSSQIAQSINSYILKTPTDALALCSVNRNLVERIFHKSVIKSISAFCSYPVLVFHK